MSPDRYAAIDCGTNSTRVLISDGTSVLDRRMTITRLGEGVNRTGALASEAIGRTVDVLRDYRRLLDDHGVPLDARHVRMTATSAARDATNREEFFSEAHVAIGVPAELLSGQEEGQLAFRGATSELHPERGPFLVVDIGGGSTEFIAGTTEPTGIYSADVGCVRLSEMFLHSDPPDPGELADAIALVRTHLDDVVREVPEAREAVMLVGLAGTVTTMAAVEMGLQQYDRDRIHHFVLTRAAAEDVFRTLATESLSDRVHNPGLERERADVIVGGAIVLVTIMRSFGFDECLVSEADILDGLVAALIDAGETSSGPARGVSSP